MSNNIFYIEWEGKYTAKSWRMEVYGAGSTLSSPQYIKIDRMAVNTENIEWSFKDIPMGINSNCGMKLVWELDYIHNDELETLLFNPRVAMELPTDIDSVPFDTGNVYILKCDNVVVYRGIQLTDEALGFDGSNKYEVELTGLSKYLVTCFDLKLFISLESHLNRLHTHAVPAIYEYYDKYLYNGIRSIVNVSAKFDVESKKDRYMFWDLERFENWINTALNVCATKIMRVSTSVDFKIPFATYYKQDYQGNQTLGSELLKSEVHILTYIVRKNETVGGLFAYSSSDSMGGKYTTLYDLLSDWAESEGQKYFLSPDGLTIRAYPMFSENPTTINLNEKFSTLKKAKKFNYKQVTVSLEEFGSSDVDNYRFNDGTPRNNEEKQIILLWNNTPPANNYRKVKANDYDESTAVDIYGINVYDIFISYDPVRVWNFYYIDQPAELTASRAFRVHDFCKSITRIRSNVATEGMGTEPSIVSVDYDTVNDAHRYCLAVQVEHSKASMFKRLNIYFGMDKVCRLEITIPFIEYTFNQIFAGANNIFTFDLTEFTSKATGYPTEYHLTKAIFNIENESFDLTFVGIKV